MKKFALEDFEKVENLEDQIEEDGACILTNEGEEKFFLLDYNKYQFLEQMLDDQNAGRFPAMPAEPLAIKVVTDDDLSDITEEEFEKIKDQLIDALEASLLHKNKGGDLN